MQQVQPDEVYNLGAQSHVAVSFEEPEYTANSDAMGTLRLLEAIRILGLAGKTRFYQASTSEMFGLVQRDAAEGDDAVPPALAVRRGQALRATGSPSTTASRTGCTRATASCSTTNRRSAARPSSRARSPARSRASCSGSQDCLYLGNLDARRDWGHAKDYVRAMWLMLQQPAPEDFVIATGEQHSVREFVDRGGRRSSASTLAWEGARRRRSRTRRQRRSGTRRRRSRRAIDRPHRSPLFPPGRSGHAAGRRDQGAGETRLGAGSSASPSSSRRWCARTCARRSATRSSSGTGTRCTSATMASADRGSPLRDVVRELDVLHDDERARTARRATSRRATTTARPTGPARRCRPEPLNTRCQVQARRRMCGGSLTTITRCQPCFCISARMLVGLLVAVAGLDLEAQHRSRHAARGQEFGAPREVGRRRGAAVLEAGQHDRRREALAVERERAQRALAVVAAQHDDRVGMHRRLRRRFEPVARLDIA